MDPGAPLRFDRDDGRRFSLYGAGMTVSRPTEDELIARYFAPLARHPGADGLRDDAALLLPPAGQGLVVTADALVASVHFLPDDPPETIARKALRVNLSDLAAKGAAPHGFILCLALPGDWTEPWVAGFAAGLAGDAAQFAFPLLGGDTVRTPGPLTIAVTAVGLVPGETMPRRSGARPGDALYVSGTIGDGALGLRVRLGRDDSFRDALDSAMRTFLVDRYRVPQPRVTLAAAIHEYASAAMDVSDGLVGDLGKLIAASGVGAEIAVGAVPLSPAAAAAIAADATLLPVALTGGDDYEILCAVPQGRRAAFETAAAAVGVPVAPIGQVTDKPALVLWRDGEGRALDFGAGRFSHF